MDESEQRITSYLLGALSEDEQTALEEKYFNDRQFFDQVVQVENNLVDRYARGLLSQEVRVRMERHYLAHPKRRERAKFAETLVTKVDQNSAVTFAPDFAESWWTRLVTSMRRPRLAWAFSVILLMLALVAFWLLIESRRLHQALAKTDAERATQVQREQELNDQVANERQRSQQLSAELDRLRAEQQAPSPTPTVNSAPSFVSLALLAGGVRGIDAGPPAALVIPAGTQQVRIQLSLRESDYQSYQVELQPAGSKEIFNRQSLHARTNRSGASLTLIIPASKFSTGDYILTLKGVTQSAEVEDVSKSLFHVEKK